eukprot:404513-Prymnesium_polylepis.1
MVVVSARAAARVGMLPPCSRGARPAPPAQSLSGGLPTMASAAAMPIAAVCPMPLTSTRAC